MIGQATADEFEYPTQNTLEEVLRFWCDDKAFSYENVIQSKIIAKQLGRDSLPCAFLNYEPPANKLPTPNS